MKKYRVKLNNRRIIGPLNENQILELYRKGYIDYHSSAQSFPDGQWLKIEDDPDLLLIFTKHIKSEKNIPKKTNDELTVVNYLVSKNLQEIKKESTKTPIQVEDHALLNSEHNDNSVSMNKEKLSSVKNTRANEISKAFEDKEDDSISISSEENLQEYKPELDVENKEKQEDKSEDAALVNSSSQTQAINIQKYLAEIKSESEQFEEEIKINEKSINKSKKDKIKEEISKRKSLVPALLIIILLGIFFLDEKEKNQEEQLKISYPSISFPTIKEYLDQEKSKQLFIEGIEKLGQEDYQSLLDASTLFKDSLEYEFKGNEALDYLILTYAMLFNDVRPQDRATASMNIFQLVQIASNKQFKSENVVLGMSLFYDLSGKTGTSVKVIENYMSLNNPSLTIISHYLHFLVKLGYLVKASKVLKKAEPINPKPSIYYFSKAKFLELDQRFEEAKSTIQEGLNIYKDSIFLRIFLCDILIQLNDFNHFSTEIKKLSEYTKGMSPYYLSKYYEKLGYKYIIEKNNKEAIVKFKKAFELHESNELRSKLASLEIGGDKIEKKIIVESKIIENMRLASKSMADENWEQAFVYAIKAVDLDDQYIPSSLLLVEIQIRRGYFSSAIKTLEDLNKKYPLDPEINLRLVDVFTRAGKTQDAKRIITNIGNNPEITNTAQYASLLGKYYLKINNIPLASRELEKSIKRDPLNDADYYELAQMYLRFRKYDKARVYLNKCIELDPMNVEYRVKYANILYEFESPATAIGYLRDVLEENKENAKVLSNIAIYYFKSGQMPEFNKYKEIVDKQPKKDDSFYKFLMESSMQEGDIKGVLQNGQSYFSVNPGDIETRINVVEYLFKRSSYDYCKELLDQIKERLPSYPRINYYYAKIAIAKNDFASAIKFGDEEIKLNPNLYYGHYITGEAYRLSGDYPKAIKYFETSIQLNPNSTETLISLGWIKRKQNYLEQAREFYMRAKKRDAGNAEIYRELGYIYKDSGQSSLAIESFKVYLEIQTDAPDKAQIESLINQLQ